MDRPTDEMKSRLRDALEKRNMTQQELSERTKIPKASISQYLSGYSKPKSDRIYSISKALDVSETWLLGYDVPMNRSGEKNEETNVTPYAPTNSARIPVYGAIPAGIPLEAIDNIEGYVDIPDEWLKSGDQYFALKVKGDSMVPKYLDGDLILLKRQPDCESGQDAAVRVNGGSATLKKVIKQQFGVILQPLNSEYEPMMYSYDNENNPVEIMGVVVQLRRDV